MPELKPTKDETPAPDPMGDMEDLHRLRSVEIFSAGKWNGEEFTEGDLDEMVKAFEENKDHIRPFLKLGHSDEQELLKAEGLPAAGWVESLYRKGDKLMADFFDMPNKIYQLVMKKAYRKVSCEIYTNCQIKDKKYKYLVGAVALLGAETPGVMNLDDILAQYRLLADSSKNLYAAQRESLSIKTYSFKTETFQTNQGEHSMSKTEREIELEAKLAAIEAEKKAADEKVVALEGETKKFAAEKAETAEKLFQAEVDKTVEALAGEKLITPAMKPYVAALLGREKESFSVGEKTLKKTEIVKELLQLFKAAGKVNLDESSTDSRGDESQSKTQDAVLAEVEKYAADNKLSFAAAYRVVAKKYEAQLQSKPMGTEEQ